MAAGEDTAEVVTRCRTTRLFPCGSEAKVSDLHFFIEGFGIVTPDVYALRDKFHLPGTCVLQFAFDGDVHNPYLPENFTPIRWSTPVPTTARRRQSYEELSETQRQNLWRI